VRSLLAATETIRQTARSDSVSTGIHRCEIRRLSPRQPWPCARHCRWSTRYAATNTLFN